MNIVIVGNGEVGSHVARVLIAEQHSVTIVDNSEAAIGRAESLLDARIVRGHGASPQILRQAGVSEACDLFVAVTGHCELNLVAAITARGLGARRTIARVLDPAYFEVERALTSGLLGVDVIINPMFQVAAEIRRLVRSRTAIAIQDFANHQIEMVQLHVEMGADVVNRPLRDIALPDQTIVVGIIRGDEFLIPNGNNVLLAGDEVVVVGRTNRVLESERLFIRRRLRQGRRAFIVGGTLVGENVARSLEVDGFTVVLLEPDVARSQQLARQLHGVVVLNADGTNAALLEEEGVRDADVFIAVSEKDELNLMACLLAKDLGARRCVALLHRSDYAHVCERVGIDTTLSPRLAIAKQVVKFVREGDMISLSSLLGGRAEFVEFLVPAEARITGRQLQAAQIPQGAVVCAVLSGNEARVPRGDYVFKAGDHVVALTNAMARPHLERLFKRSGFGLDMLRTGA